MIQSSPRKLPNGLVLPCPPLPENQLVKLSTRNEKHVHHEDGRQQELSVRTQLLGLLPWQSYTRYIQNRPLATAVLTWYILQAPVPRSAGPAGSPPLQHRQGWEVRRGSPRPSQWQSRAGRGSAGTSSSWLAPLAHTQPFIYIPTAQKHLLSGQNENIFGKYQTAKHHHCIAHW